jgi:hypothetical protein
LVRCLISSCLLSILFPASLIFKNGDPMHRWTDEPMAR